MTSPSPEFDRRADLALMQDAARAAGAIILKYYRGEYRQWSKGAAGPVTEADLEADAHLKETLLAARPDYGWLSEETPDSPERLSKRRVFVVDPLDGTRAFIEGEPHFCVALALVEDGAPVAGVVFNPVLDEMFEAAQGLGARLNAAKIGPSSASSLEGVRMAAAPGAFHASKWDRAWPPMQVEQRRALAYRGALVACGAFDAMVSFGYKREWDVAAPAAIALEAGACVTDPWGAPFAFNAPDSRVAGVVIAGPALHPLLIERARAMPHPSQSSEANT
jgi:myo-inositol-1(or 4)-monophosphatase